MAAVNVKIRLEDQAENFKIDCETLLEIVASNSVECLEEHGGLQGLLEALETNVETGILGSNEDLHRRQVAFGSNDPKISTPPFSTQESGKGLPGLFSVDTTAVLLLLCGSVALAAGMLKYGPDRGWHDGAVIILSALAALAADLWRKRRGGRQVRAAATASATTTIDIMRDGVLHKNVSASEVVAGDILHLKPGDVIPADGLLILDDYCGGAHSGDYHSGINKRLPPFIFAGMNLDGASSNCRMLVTCVGKNTIWTKTKMRSTTKKMKAGDEWRIVVEKLSSNLEKFALALSFILLLLHLSLYLITKSSKQKAGLMDGVDFNYNGKPITGESTKHSPGLALVPPLRRIVAIASVLLLATREGLQVGLHIALIYSKNFILEADRQATVMDLTACVTSGLVTTIIWNPPASIFLNHLYPLEVELWVGNDKVRVEDMLQIGSHELLKALSRGVCLNSFGPADRAQLTWVQQALGIDVWEMMQSWTIVEQRPCDVDDRCSRVRIRSTKNESLAVEEVQCKGDPTLVLEMCSKYYCVDGSVKPLIDVQRHALIRQMNSLKCAEDGFTKHFVAFAYKSSSVLLSAKDGIGTDDERISEDDEELEGCLESKEAYNVNHITDEERLTNIDNGGLTLLAILGFNYSRSYLQGLLAALDACKNVGININILLDVDRVVNPNFANFEGINLIINSSHLYHHNHVLQHIGPFDNHEATSSATAILRFNHNYASTSNSNSNEDNDNNNNNNYIGEVIVNPSPLDKLCLLQHMRREGQVVAVIVGNCSGSDRGGYLWLLEEADLVLWVSDGREQLPMKGFPHVHIEILEQSFASIAMVMHRGRWVLRNVQRIIRLHLTVTLVGMAANFISMAISQTQMISSAQLFWVGLVADTLGAFALAMDHLPLRPSKVMKGKQATNNPSENTFLCIMGKGMWMDVLCQVVCQTSMLLALHLWKKEAILVFNSYVLCQVFVTLVIGCDDGISIFRNQKRRFLCCIAAVGVLQLVVIEVNATLLQKHGARMDIHKWGISIGLAAISQIGGWLGKKMICRPN